MIKKIVILFIFVQICLGTVFASELKNTPYKELKEKAKVCYSNDIWTTKINKNNDDYFIKLGTDLYSEKNDLIIPLDVDSVFIVNNSLIGYSNSMLKFYDLTLNENSLEKRELLLDEVQELFKDYKIIKISDFCKTTNSIKLKKDLGVLKIILLNDTEQDFQDYTFTTGNSKFEKYKINGFLDISKKGMIQFSSSKEDTGNSSWFIILIR